MASAGVLKAHHLGVVDIPVVNATGQIRYISLSMGGLRTEGTCGEETINPCIRRATPRITGNGELSGIVNDRHPTKSDE